MDLSVAKDDLNRTLQVTQNIVAKRSTMPILSNLLISASGDELKICASDLEITTLATVKAKIQVGGSTTISARVFSDIIRELPEGDVQLRLKEGERLEIFSNRSRFRIIGISAEEYPSLPGMSFEARGRISAAVLLDMVNKTLYAVSHDETRFNLNGVCFEMMSESDTGTKKSKSNQDVQRTLRLVATDGHRLALISRPVGDFTLQQKAIVPKRGLSEVKRILDAENDGEVGIDVHEGFFLIQTRDFKVSMRLIDGEYPDCSAVIPQDKGTLVNVDASLLGQALKRVMLVVTDKEKCVRMGFSSEALRISSSSPELGEASEEIALTYGGEPLTVGFNAAYLVDMVSSLGENKNLCIELHGELGPGKFYEQNDESAISIVMPMRL